ncbi:MAG: bifunctional nuclease family protein [Bacteroidaceae bacterium]|nr:bifunctional nuclease family protein [Bacteroidaceae bacterium]
MGDGRKIEMVVGEILNRKPSDLALIALLKEKDAQGSGLRCLPVLVGPLEAQAIVVSLFRHKIPHPGIYDLYLDTIASFDCHLVRTEIFKVKGGIFYSHLFMERDGNTSYIECRTADALALSVRRDIPIYIGEELLESNCVRLQPDGAYSLPISTASTQVLKEALEQAVATENYEFAARLRDELNSRDQNGESDMNII